MAGQIFLAAKKSVQPGRSAPPNGDDQAVAIFDNQPHRVSPLRHDLRFLRGRRPGAGDFARNL
jgi:hypothetical protein